MCEFDIPVHRRRCPDSPAGAAEVTRLKGALGQLQWLATQGCPRISAELSLLLGYQSVATVDTLLQANKLVRKARVQAQIKIPFRFIRNPSVVTWTDAAWGIRRDQSSQGGYFVGIAEKGILFGDEESPVNLVSWHSGKLTRVSRSSCDAEVQGASEGEEEGEYVRLVLSELMCDSMSLFQWQGACARVPDGLVLDCRGLYDALGRSESSCLGLKDKRSALEALALKRSMTATGSALRWGHSASQLADCMTKSGSKAGAPFDLFVEKGFRWRLVFDPDYISAKRRVARGLRPLDPTFDTVPPQATPGLEKTVDAWEFIENRLGALTIEQEGFGERWFLGPDRAINLRNMQARE